MSAFGVDVLAFGPHPDDVELFCGGTMARSVELGRTTAIVDLSLGERASRGTVEERAREAKEAAVVLGVSSRDNLGLPDTGIDAGSEAQLLAVVRAVRERRPEIVLAPWSEERHPDHVAASALITKAIFFSGLKKLEVEGGALPHVPRQVLYYQMRVRMIPSFIVDTSSAWPTKSRAIMCHRSQLAPRDGTVATTLIGSPGAMEAIEARDRYFGSFIGVSHGEPLRAQGTLGVVDPVALFRDNPFTRAHAFEASP